MKQFLSVHDAGNAGDLVREARALKQNPFVLQELGRNRTLGLVFFNSSLRTRLSTQRAARNLGMDVIVLNTGQDAWQLEFADGTVMDGGSAEHIREAAAVLGEYCDIIGVRAFPGLKDREEDAKEGILDGFVRWSGRPVISLESATRHPLQSLADCITIDEYRTRERPKVVLTWAPHPRALPQSVANSFVEWMRHMDVDLIVTHPEGYDLAPSFMGDVPIIYNQDEALAGADFVYAKNWSSYQEYGQIIHTDHTWMISAEKMALTRNGRFMHCLPVRRNVVVADAVLDSEASIVIPQAGNRIWSAQAVIKRMLEAASW